VDVPQDHPFQALGIEHSIGQGRLGGLQQGLARIVLDHAEEAAQEPRDPAGGMGLEPGHIAGQPGFHPQQFGLVGGGALPRPPLATLGPVLRLRELLVAGVPQVGMAGHEIVVHEHLDPFSTDPHFHPAPGQFEGHRIPVAVQVHVSRPVHRPGLQAVDGGHPYREAMEQAPLRREQIDGPGVDVSLEGGIPLLAPGPGPSVEIRPVLKLAARQEVVFQVLERGLDAALAIGIVHLVGPEHEPESLAEGLHLRRRDHVPARSLGDDHVRIVDHTTGAGAAEKLEGFREKDLAPETSERRVVLGKDHVRMGQNETGALEIPVPAPEAHPVRGSVVLHLGAGPEVVLPLRELRGHADSVATAVAREGLVGEGGPPRDQLLVDPHQVLLAALV